MVDSRKHKRNFDTISEITIKDITRQAIKVLRFITDTDEVERHYQSVLKKKEAIQDRFVQRFESALQSLAGNTSRRLPLVAHQPP